MTKIKAVMKGDSRVVTGVVRLAFVNLFSPRPNDDGTPGRYDVCILIDKDDKSTIDCINKAVEAAKARGVKEKWAGKLPKNLLLPLKDGDDREDDQYGGFENCMFLNARSKSRPGIVDKTGAKILDEEELYSGCYALCGLSFFPYDNNSKGVGVSIDNVMKIKDGEALAGKPSAESDFAGVAIDDDEDDDDL